MKKVHMLLIVLLCTFAVVLFQNSGSLSPQDDETYVIVTYASQDGMVSILRGGTKVEVVKKGIKAFDRVGGMNEAILVLNELNKKGYTLVSSTTSTHKPVRSDYDDFEYTYVMKKRD